MQIRPCDVDRSGDVWRYTVPVHKTEHHGKPRLVYIGSKGQAILRPYLLRLAEEPCFQPRDSETKRKAAMRARRKTPVQPSQRDRSKKNPKKRPGRCYSKDSFNWGIRRVCNREGIPRWTANQLRHAFATEIRRAYGVEGAQLLLGHSRLETTQVYAEKNDHLAAKILREVG
jgi:integrase